MRRKSFLVVFLILISILLFLYFLINKKESFAYPEGDSPYGINPPSGIPFWNSYTLGEGENLAPLLKEAGVKWYRLWIHWMAVEEENNSWNEGYLSKVTDLIDALKRENIKIVVVLTATPDWAANSECTVSPKKFCVPGDLNEYEEFVGEVVRRFGNQVDAWEIENEISEKQDFWKNKEVYNQMFTRAKNIIKENDPSDLVLLSSFVPIIYEDYHIRIKYWLKEVGPQADVLNIHKYGTDSEVLGAIDVFKSFINQVKAEGVDLSSKPIWLTETNICKGPKYGCNEANAGEKLKNRFTKVLRAGISKVFWFNFKQPNPNKWGPGILEKDSQGVWQPYPLTYCAYREISLGRGCYQLNSGWNSIVWKRIPEIRNALEMINDINNQCGEGTTKIISFKNYDWWEDYVLGGYGNNFRLINNKNYLIKTERNCLWLP